MISTENTSDAKLAKCWIVSISLFLIVQFIFFLVDGTVYDPNINDSQHLFVSQVRRILDSKPFTEWFSLFTFPFFYLCLAVHIIALLIQAGQDITRFFKK